MTATCTVMENGKLAWVALPDEWQEANNIKEGDVLEVITDVKGQITFSKPTTSERLKTLSRLFEAVDSLPKIPWEGGSSPADDKRKLGERCSF